MWHEQQEALLTKLWADGLSATQVAKELNKPADVGITRNAVIGKVHRLGLTGRARAASQPSPRRIRVSPASIRIMQQRAKPQAAPAPPPEIFTSEHMIQFHKLDNHHCRWPLWTDTTPHCDQFYCGTPTANVSEGFSYCGYHSRVSRDGSPESKADKPAAMQAAE